MKSRWVQKIGYTESEGLLHFQLTSDVVLLVANSKNTSQATTFHKRPTLPVPMLLVYLNY